jgi:hypothetical protein
MLEWRCDEGEGDYTFEMAELRVGFGAELFAPKSRFIVEKWLLLWSVP